MRALVQRVSGASVAVDGAVAAEIGAGLLVLLGVARSDTGEDAAWLARKVAGLRLFDDEKGRMERSLVDGGGDALCVSQFTLYASTRKGKRPSFTEAAPAELAEPLYEQFCEALAAEGVRVERGLFGARMKVALTNEGPVTLMLSSPAGGEPANGL